MTNSNRSIRLAVAFLLTTFSSRSFAETNYFSAELAAKSVAARMNELTSKTLFLELVNPALSPQERAGIERNVSASDFSRPSNCRAVKNRVVCADGSSVTFNADRSINSSGRVWQPPQSGKLDHFVEEFVRAQKDSYGTLFIPRASANPAVIALALVTLSVMGCFADYVYAGIVYFGKDVYHSIRDGEVFCDGDSFAIRTKIKDANGFPGTHVDKIDTSVISQLMNQKIATCTRPLADKFALKLKTSKLPTEGGANSSTVIH